MIRIRVLLLTVLTGLAILPHAGCTILQPTRDDAVRTEARIGPGKVTPAEIQSNVMAFSDHHGQRLWQALDELPVDELTTRQRGQILAATLASRESAFLIAAGPNPLSAFVDMLVTTRITADAMEVYLPRVAGDATEPLTNAFRQSERELWGWAGNIMTEEQQGQLVSVIEAWQAANPDQYLVAYVRFTDFAAFRQVAPTEDQKARNIFGLFYLDPLASMDPTAREIARSRLLAERALFYSQRLPQLVSGEAQLFFNDVLEQPRIQALMEGANTATAAVETYARLAEELPDLIAAEREAAVAQIADEYREQTSVLVDRIGERYRVETGALIDQASDRMSDQREAFLATLESEETGLRAVMVELRDTIDASTELSASVDTTVASVDRLVAQMAANRDPNAPPLNIMQVNESLAQANEVARELSTLLERVDALMVSSAWTERAADADGLLAATEQRGAQLINRALRAGLILIAVFLVGSVVAMLVYRSIARRLFETRAGG